MKLAILSVLCLSALALSNLSPVRASEALEAEVEVVSVQDVAEDMFPSLSSTVATTEAAPATTVAAGESSFVLKSKPLFINNLISMLGKGGDDDKDGGGNGAAYGKGDTDKRNPDGPGNFGNNGNHKGGDKDGDKDKDKDECIPQGASVASIRAFNARGCTKKCPPTGTKPPVSTPPSPPKPAPQPQPQPPIGGPIGPITPIPQPTPPPQASIFAPVGSDKSVSREVYVEKSSSSSIPWWLIALLVIILLIVIGLLLCFCWRSSRDASKIDKLSNLNNVESFESQTATPVYGAPETTVDVYESTTTTTYPNGLPAGGAGAAAAPSTSSYGEGHSGASNYGQTMSRTQQPASYNNTMQQPSGGTMKYGTASPNTMFASRS